MFILKHLISKNLHYHHHHHHLFRCLSLSNSNNKLLNEDISLCVIGNGSEGNPRSLFLNYNDRIFMFNCGEGLQRLISDLGYKSSKIEAFFTTSNQWSNVSGLSSLLLTRYDANCKKFNVQNKFNETLIQQCIVFDTKLKRIKFEYFDSNSFCYEKLSIKAVPIELENIKTVIYLASLSPEKGKINLEKCFHSKVPRNLVSQLEQNHCVTNQDGKIIKPSDVCDRDYPEQNFLIFECFQPEKYLNQLFKNPLIEKFLPKCEAIIHFTKDDYLSSRIYQDFINRLKNSYHLLITESNPFLSLYSTHRFQIQLNYLDSELFPLLRDSDDKRSIQFSDSKVIYSQTGLKYVLRSQDQLESSSPISTEKIPQPPTFHDALLYKDGDIREGIEEITKDLKAKQSSLPSTTLSSYPEFIFLGTASSISLPIRNVSIILVNLDERNSILIECGENAYGQLLNFYGQQKIDKVLSKIKAIFISHHHSDHHLGLIRFLEKHQQHCPTIPNKLWILLPPMVHKFLKSNIFQLNRENYHLIANQYFENFKHKIIDSLNIKDIDLIPVSHCAYAFGISIVDKENFKFVYSGDTQPCDQLIERGKNCNLLIHEATVEDSLIQFARTHFHSTLSEAIDVGKSMNAQFNILTHFSQRYGKLPFLPDEKNSQNVGLAFDNMKFNPSQLNRIPLLYEPLKCMYSKHLDRLKHRSDLYQRKYGQ